MNFNHIIVSGYFDTGNYVVPIDTYIDLDS